MAPNPGTYFVVPQESIDAVLPKMGGAAAKVFLYLCRHADSETGECFRSQETIGEGCGFGVRTVRNCLTELGELGVLEIRNRGQRSNLYTVRYPAKSCRLEDDLTGTELPVRTSLTGTVLPVSDNLTGKILPDKNLTGNSVHFNRQNGAAYQASLSNKKEEESFSVSNSGKKKPAKGKTAKSQPVGYSQAFKNFYAIYPRKVAKGKAAEAFTNAVSRLVDDPERQFANEVEAVEFLKRRAAAYAVDVTETPTEFQAHPSTWLNQDRFDDEYAADKASAKAPSDTSTAGIMARNRANGIRFLEDDE